MHGREQIGGSELGFLIFGFLLGSSLLLPMGASAKEAAWLATLLGGGAGLALAWVWGRLHALFPDMTLIGYSRRVLGPWAGGLVGLLYVWYALHLGSLVLRNFGEFLITSLLPDTPISVIHISLMLLSVYAVRHGLEPLGRSAQILVIVVVGLIAATSVLLAKEVKPPYFLPLLGDGIPSILRAAATVLAFPFGEVVLFSMVLNRVRPSDSARRSLLISMGAAVLLLTLVTALGVGVLGVHIRGASRFASLAMIRQILIADFITNLDAVVVGAWVSTGYLKVSACLYICATALAELLGLDDFRPLLFPLAAIVVGLSILVYQDTSQMAAFLSVWPVYSAPFQILLPLLLLVTAAIRRRFGASGGTRPAKTGR